ncbi:Rhomboid protein [Fasciola gigantica]|uniref:Rhomboid protein n=1 Tax=Fasciola gigantica TaxID=46835 RepID=A0A504Z5W5_FASGI|nr:Rhomboid protein [Fasciola gigantica]
MAASKKNRQLREYLDKNFKPVFDEYESSGGIPFVELRKLLGESDLPREKIYRLIEAADADGDEKITYDEFIHQLFFEDENVIKKLRIRRRVLNRAVLAIDPSAGRRHQQEVLAKAGYDEVDTYNWGEADVDNYIEAYDCRPPPIFIPLVTLAEVTFRYSRIVFSSVF